MMTFGKINFQKKKKENESASTARRGEKSVAFTIFVYCRHIIIHFHFHEAKNVTE